METKKGRQQKSEGPATATTYECLDVLAPMVVRLEIADHRSVELQLAVLDARNDIGDVAWTSAEKTKRHERE